MRNIPAMEATVLAYTSAWNGTEHTAIAEKIEQCWAPGATYIDKLTDTLICRDAIVDLIVNSYTQMGPRTFKVLG